MPFTTARTLKTATKCFKGEKRNRNGMENVNSRKSMQLDSKNHHAQSNNIGDFTIYSRIMGAWIYKRIRENTAVILQNATNGITNI